MLLQTALEAHDRMKSCQAAINRDGESLSDRFGQVKPHPLLAAERDARSAMIQALKSLNLDIETTQPIGRPSGGHL
ncbi:MAG TPA: P27 family phage terminase small subunit [Rhodanobacteraceae bacterium]|nr:P27 family phage terminase small subunit [Rhodanobacteraceae bacterium]